MFNGSSYLKPSGITAIRAAYAEISRVGTSMRLTTIPTTKMPTEDIASLRSDFNVSIRTEFFTYLARKRPHQLQAFLEINDEDIAYMQVRGLVALPRNTIKLLSTSCSVYHIKPLRWGGTNDVKNLCLLPKRINNIKERFEVAQLQLNPNRATIEILIPPLDSNGDYEIMPKFPDCYY